MQDQRLDAQNAKKRVANGNSLPTKAISGLPLAQRNQARRLQRENSVPIAYTDDDVQCRRHYCTQQKAGVVQGRVDQDILLDD